MALITCPECGKEISDRADTCPHCGYPIKKEENNVIDNVEQTYPDSFVVQENVEKKGQSVLGVFALIFSILGCTFWLGAILAIVDLNKHDNKKKTCSVISLIISTIWLAIVLVSMGSNKDNSKELAKEEIQEVETEEVQEDSIAQEDSIVQQEDNNHIEEQIMKTGTYVVGDDIDSGKYNFIAKKGTGTLYIYNSYEDYKSDEYGNDAFKDFNMMAEGASVGLLNEDVYTDKVSNIRLNDGQCIVVDKGLELYYGISENVSSNEINAGTYIVGEDITAGKYNFEAIKGSGSLSIYNTYDEYLDDEYGNDAFQSYDMKEENASVGLLNEDVYTDFVSNVKLEDGQCIYIEDGLKINVLGNAENDSLLEDKTTNEKQIEDKVEKEAEAQADNTEENTDDEENGENEEEAGDDVTLGKRNALKSAEKYLRFSTFSYEGLIGQLEYEKYSHDEAVYAADNCGADWNDQAVKKAKSYIELSSFSKDSLIEQLEYEGFTHEQAVYGAEQNGY